MHLTQRDLKFNLVTAFSLFFVLAKSYNSYITSVLN